MKKLFFFATAALVIAACAKTSLDNTATPDVPVTFQAANYSVATKAGEVSVFGDFKNFQCLAYLHAVGVDLNADGTQKAATSQDFFGTGETISPYDNTNAVIANPTPATTDVAYWAPSHSYYWPKDEHSYVNFVAWYGTDGTNAINPSVSYNYVSDEWKATMTWNYSNATIGEVGANLLYADMAWRYNGNLDASYKLNGLAAGYKGVPMLFHHALAQINVKAYALKGTDPSDAQAITAGSGTVTDGIATWTILLKNVKVTPVIKDGTLALTNEDPGTNKTQAWTGTWAGSSAAGDMVRSGDFAVDKVSKATAGDLIAATCVIPQSLGASVVLSFDLDITTAYGGGVSHHEIIPISIKLNDMGTDAWAMNTKYTYFLQSNPSQKTVLFDPALEADWTEGSTTEKTL